MANLEVRELLAAMPADMDDAWSDQPELDSLAERISRRTAPTGMFRRMWTMTSLQSRVALAYLAYWLRRGYLTTTERERLLNETHLRSALKLLAGLTYLRGIAMKVGQTLANYPRILPREFVDTLGKLNFEAPPMHYSLVGEQIRSELGGEPEDVFAEFERRAFAAASLGQVHRARLRSGENVVVKVQYPGIARTIDSDCRALLLLLAPMRLTGMWDSIRRQTEDIRAMLQKEADYQQEAEYLRRARASFRDDEGIVVPRVYSEHSTERVITMDYLDGVHLEAYLNGRPSQEERDRYGELIMRASFRLAHTTRLWYADSNPGNYLFLRDGRLGVIDFGCCREFNDEEWDYYRESLRAHREGGEALRRFIIRATGFTAANPPPDEQIELLAETMHWYSDYLLIDGTFDFGEDAFIQRGIDLTSEMMRKGYVNTLPVNTWITRQLLGLRALAFRLGARINMKKLEDDEHQPHLDQ